ncbi:heme peroxidase [Streptomyces spinoverrucosus]|uniref:peroxidase family protein n=1 Tax=Streptomyces spinoverrucosus TaxID=284043 RepID=UPI0018C38303|nr:heme peroxidase family protein [Streptomyces spinoverrucosus]MBG0856658.1 heme peroxidase [Streptomyces spinoverrucosus]
MFRPAREPQTKRHVRSSFYVVGEGVLADSGDDRPARAQTPSTVAALRRFRFSRLGPQARENQLLDRAARAELARAMTDPERPQPDSGNPKVPAGFTYLGQLVDHDLTLDATAVQLEDDITVRQLLQGRSPALDLDCLYGLGPGHRFDRRFYDDDGIRLKTGTTQGVPGGDPVTGLPLGGFDLPRVGTGSLKSERRRPLIPDPRNDENLVVAQLHCAFIRFHNRFAMELAGQGVSSAVLFESAREAVVKHYQWMLRHDFLPRIVDESVLDEVFTKGRRFFEPSPGEYDHPTMPVEFSVAAYRLGHSMVRGAYNWNRVFDNGAGTLPLLFQFTGTSGILSPPPADPADPEAGDFERLPTNWIADFRRLFDFREAGRDDLGVPGEQFNLTKRIDTLLVNPLADLPLGSFGGRGRPPADPIELNLAFRNLTRANMMRLATGQQMARHLGVKPLLASDFDNRDGARLSDGLRRQLADNCPLWFYVLREAEVNGGGRLTGVGGRIVAEVFHRAMEGSRHSIVRDPFWRPFLSPVQDRRAKGVFEMTDLLLYAFEERADLLNPLGP